MRTFLKLLLALLVLLLVAAVVVYQLYLKVGEYAHQGPLVTAPSTQLEADADWQTLFDGATLAGWQPKFVGHAAGVNYKDTFRVQEGAITVSYDGYDQWGNEFGHLFYETPFASYLLQLEYRFTGEQAPGGAAWAWRNSGVMIHSEPPSSMTLDQQFPVSLEAQLLGAREDGERRPTANLCTPGTHVILQGELHTQHCINSMSPNLVGDDWVQLELEVRGGEVIRHFINGELVLEYAGPRLDTWLGDGRRLQEAGADVALTGGYIALQSESHPVQFRNIRLLEID